MGDINLRASDPLNYQLPGSLSLMWLPKNEIDEEKWEDFGNIVSSSLAPNMKMLEHFSIRRGTRAKDRVIIAERNAMLNFVIDEINQHNLQKAFSALTDDIVDDEVEHHDDKIKLNPGGNGEINLKRTDITDGTLIVRNPELSEDQTPYVEGTDYTFDSPSGIVTILDTGALNDNSEEGGVPKLHFQWSENFASKSFQIFSGTEVEGKAKFQVMTPGGIKYIAIFNNCVIRNNGDINFGDGSTWHEIALQLDILVDEDGVLGTMHIIEEE